MNIKIYLQENLLLIELSYRKDINDEEVKSVKELTMLHYQR
jgi:hypothetical protein